MHPTGRRRDLPLALEKLDARLMGWHPRSRDLAVALAERMGVPDEVSAWRAVWYDRGPWKRTTVYADPVEHRWPVPHEDMLEQVVDYQVAPELVPTLMQFHGGLCVHRTRGELAVCCESEAANLAALNLAHDLAEDRTTLHKARLDYVGKFTQRGEREDPYLARLLFGRQVGAADPDEPHGRYVRALPIRPEDERPAAGRSRAR